MLYPKTYGENPLFPQACDFQVITKDNSTGYGVLALRDFKAGDLVAAITGEVVPEILQHTLQIDQDSHLLDLHFTGYLLHSCSPNISVDMQNMTVTALKDIPANTFLTMDYAQTEAVLYKQFPCSCGSDDCRGWITGSLEMPVGSIANYEEANV
ncbi:MAG: SET domain-containing protein-lysine N-methyltransferase [Pseudohongiellaceae bacterium]